MGGLITMLGIEAASTIVDCDIERPGNGFRIFD